jgi:hypothetical protein
MITMKRAVSAGIALVLLIGAAMFGVSPTSAASRSDNQAKKAALETQYGVRISFEQALANDQTIQGRLLDTLRKQLDRFPAGLIKEATDGLRAKKVASAIYVRAFTERDNPALHGSFGVENGKATLTYRAAGGVLEDWVVSHEIGHLIHEYLRRGPDASAIQKTWVGFNGSYVYNKNWASIKGDHELVFAREYGSASYSEDFATIVEDLIYRPDHVRIRLLEAPKSGYARKIAYLTQLLQQRTKAIPAGGQPWKRAVPERPSDDLAQIASAAFDKGLIPSGGTFEWAGYATDFRGIYQSSMSKHDFAQLIAAFMERRTGMTLEELAKEKGKYTKWKTTGSISFNGKQNVMKETTNYPLNDIEDFRVFHLYKLGIVDGIRDTSVKSGTYRQVDAHWIYELQGLSSLKFEPEREITQGQALQMLERMTKLLELSSAGADRLRLVGQKGVRFESAYAAMAELWDTNASSLPEANDALDDVQAELGQ